MQNTIAKWNGSHLEWISVNIMATNANSLKKNQKHLSS